MPADECRSKSGRRKWSSRCGDRRYRVRGLAKNLSYDVLKVNLMASRGDGFHVDTLDLYAARQRAAFIKQAAMEMGAERGCGQAGIWGSVLLQAGRAAGRADPQDAGAETARGRHQRRENAPPRWSC